MKRIKKYEKTYIKALKKVFGAIIVACVWCVFFAIDRSDSVGFWKTLFTIFAFIGLGLAALMSLILIDMYYQTRLNAMTAKDVAKIINETEPCKYCIYRTKNGCLVGGNRCKEGIEQWLNTEV